MIWHDIMFISVYGDHLVVGHILFDSDYVGCMDDIGLQHDMFLLYQEDIFAKNH